MATEMNAVEVTGVVDELGRLSLDEPLRAIRPGRVRLIVLAPETATRREKGEHNTPSGAVDEEERKWLAAAAANPAFAFLNDPAEDVYSAQDGRPFHDQG